MWPYLGLILSAALSLACYAKFRICLNELENMAETSAYLFYREPSAADGLAKECQRQGLICETWRIGEAQGLQAEGLSHASDGYIVQLEGGRLGGLLSHAAEPSYHVPRYAPKIHKGLLLTATEPFSISSNYAGNSMEKQYCRTVGPSCMVSTQLAYALFGSGHVTGKKVLYQGTPYTIQHTVPCEIPILFLGSRASLQNARLHGIDGSHAESPSTLAKTQGASSSPTVTQAAMEPAAIPAETQGASRSLAIVMVQGGSSLDYHKTEHIFMGSDTKLDLPLLKWTAYLSVSFCSFGFLLLLFAQKSFLHKCIYAILVLLWICYLKLELFSSAGAFPLWALPGQWSDLEGWGSLWDSIGAQFSAIFQFREYPILHGYFQSLSGCPFYFLLFLFFFWGFIKIIIRLCASGSPKAWQKDCHRSKAN